MKCWIPPAPPPRCHCKLGPITPTEAGERLLDTLGPRFEEIEAELAALSELREKPAG